MLCPLCKSKLIVGGRGQMMTSIDHIENRKPSYISKYICSNKICATHAYKIYWNSDGELYSKASYHNNLNWIDSNDAPFGSIYRQLNVEVYKKDENKKFKFGKFIFELSWNYKSNYNGEILSKKPKLLLWINHSLYITGIKMFFFSIKHHYWNKKFDPYYYKKDFSYPVYAIDKKLWWKWTSIFIIRIIDRKGYLEVKNGQ